MNQFSVLVLQPLRSDFEPVYALIQAAASRAAKRTRVSRADKLRWGTKSIEHTYNEIDNADLVVADVSAADPSVMYALGYAHANSRPVLVLASEIDVLPFDLRGVRSLIYDRTRLDEDLENRLQALFEEAAANRSSFAERPTTESGINKVFISYSHRDRAFLERLLVHLKPLEREGRIDAWADTKIKAGSDWQSEIEAALKQARCAILLVSADFLASDFIVKNELPPILKQAEEGGTHVLSVVLKPCRFTRDQRLSRFQAVNDPAHPVINLPEGRQEEVFDAVGREVERWLGDRALSSKKS